MAPRVTSTRLIGRAAELAELESALADAAAGRPSVAFVAGESGVGKSRLLGELERRARDAGALVLAGDCVDLGESELPYVPLVAALRPLARAGDPALTDAVAPLLPGAGDAAPADPEPGAQARLFEGLLSLLDDLGGRAPVLLVVEDLHWADRSTRAALAFLARNLVAERVLIVASYRPDELHRRHPLRPLLAELEPRSRRIALRPLTREELADQLEDILGAPPGDELLERLWTRSGGNPLFCEELLAAGLDGRGATPDTLRDALMLRVERLPEEAQELLRLVAVGHRVDHALLEEASGLPPRALRDALREAVDGHILVAGDDGRHRFRHALLGEVVEDDLLPGERAALHLALARALAPRAGEGAVVAAAVAHHFAAAGDQPAALAASVRAATAAERVHGLGEAAALLDRALELWDRVPDPEALAGADRVTLLLRAADAAIALGDPARALALSEVAAEERTDARVLASIARAQRGLNQPRSSVATLERALALADDPDDRVRLMAALARGRMLDGHFGEAVQVAREALAAGAGAFEAHVRNSLGFSLAMAGEVDAGAEELRAAVALARERDHVPDMADAFINYSEMLHITGRTGEARAVAAEGAEAIGGRRPIAMVWLDAQQAELAFDAGEWAVSESFLPAPERWRGSHTRMNLLLRHAYLALGRGQHAAAAALVRDLEAAAGDSGEPQYLAPLGILDTELRRRGGDLDGARAAVERALDRIEFCTEDAMHISAVAAAGVAVEADAAERARDLGEDGAGRDALRRLEDLLARVAAAASPTRPVERARLLEARAEASRGAGRPDPEAYAAAAAAWEAIGRPEPAARSRLREAEARAAAGDREAATQAARAAHATAERLGAHWLRGEVEGLAARARLGLGSAGAPGPATPDDGDEPDAFGLTARERQVLALVARGATNREIGAELYMAEKTASVHVSRILSKLSVRSRTEAAAMAHRLGLTRS